ncbi:MAG: hypothetical protein RLZZ241_951 [Bacteroidota bacterium]|jgi:arylsulfatase A-like enzyme
MQFSLRFYGVILAINTFLFQFGCSPIPDTPIPQNRPNILLIFADDQRADALGASGNPYIQTPNLDRLAQEGVRFSNSYVMGGHHGAICAPSRAMLLSGKSLFHVYDRLDGVLTLPKYLSENGYQTFATGKWHNGGPSFEANFQQGKAIMLGGMSDHFKVPLQDLQDNGTFGERYEKSFSTDIFADAALEFLEQYNSGPKEKPFFCYLAFTAPHDPRSPHETYQQAYRDSAIPVPGNFKALHPFRFDDFNVRDETLAPWPRTPEIIQSSLADYYALIEHLDHRVGEIIATLKDKELFDNTLIIYAADNGLAIGSHGLLGKQNLYEHSTRVPLILSGPGIPKGQTTEALVYLYDLFPTLLEYLSLPHPEGLDGKSLMPVLLQEKIQIRPSLYTAYRNTVRAIRDTEWKLIYYPQINHHQLFNLRQDPLEIKNLAYESSYQIKVQEMMRQMEASGIATSDTLNLYPKKIGPKAYDYRELRQIPDQWQPQYTLNKYFLQTSNSLETWD